MYPATRCGSFRDDGVLSPRGFLHIIALPGAAELGVFALAVVLAATISVRLGAPAPTIHDEFSYLLAADTYVAGRATNPTHPFWKHFETFHVLQQPTYFSKFPPGQGLLLAIGWRLGGHPVVGAWLGVGMAAAAICWMLRGWVPVRWALVGGIIAATHSELLAWGHRYDGAHVAVIGAALLLGASRRFSACRPARNAVIMVLGTALMAISRPFEGLVLVLFTAVGIATNAARKGRCWAAIRMPRTWITATAVAVPCAALMAWNNGQVTGHPLHLPYIKYQETYGYSPLFLWQPLGPPKPYRHQVMQNFYTNWEVYSYRRLKTLKGFAEFLPLTLRDFSFSVFGCWLPLLPIFLRVWKVSAARTPLVTIGVLFGSLLAVPWFASAYAACAIPSACLVLTVWLRAAQRAVRDRGAPSIFLLALIPTGAILNIAGTLHLTASHRKDWAIQRSAINQKLNRQGGKHLVIVHYASDHCPLAEWVYNRADIDGASVVWARDLGSKDNEQLATYFGDRQVWMVTPDGPIVGPSPVPISATTLRHRPDRLSSEWKHDIDVR